MTKRGTIYEDLIPLEKPKGWDELGTAVVKPDKPKIPGSNLFVEHMPDGHPDLREIQNEVLQWRKMADRLFYDSSRPVAWKISGGLNLQSVGRLGKTRDWGGLNSMHLPDTTREETILWVPRIVERSFDMTAKEQMGLLALAYRRLGLKIPPEKLFKDAPTIAALIFNDFDVNGEMVPLDGAFVRTSTMSPKGRVNIGGFDQSGLGWSAHPDLDGQKLRNYGCFPLVFKSDILASRSVE